MKKNTNKKCPRAPHTSRIEYVLYTRVRIPPTSFLRIERTWRSPWTFAPVGVGGAGMVLEVAARESRWRGGREEWSLHAPVTATPVAIADTTPHAKSPFVALDRKLLFVRRLRGEFSDDETRSFWTRYSSGLRYRREREPRTNVVANRVCLFFFISHSAIIIYQRLICFYRLFSLYHIKIS